MLQNAEIMDLYFMFLDFWIFHAESVSDIGIKQTILQWIADWDYASPSHHGCKERKEAEP